ncbi:MAG: ribosome silencing factor [Anaeromicrobium sp.]|jgi:ribosome-associated protein|uniref:ribosome silencing factor n=1 Tax=Anaeromicrobium sp. TaxID=1929132 RepID=UPI0025F66E78|nr:ribosome silencing factor [Anaeromicrobium sp.]MCT4594855.1 ribosome silencing factor [Anaeromicrobium sp.]
MINNTMETVKTIIKAIDEKKGLDIRILDINNVSNIADFFVIAHGKSTRQVKAIADEVEKTLKEKSVLLGHKEGYRDGKWILLDYKDVVVHVFTEEERGFYGVERVWKDAKDICLDNF